MRRSKNVRIKADIILAPLNPQSKILTATRRPRALKTNAIRIQRAVILESNPGAHGFSEGWRDLFEPAGESSVG